MRIKENELRETVQTCIKEVMSDLKEASDYQDFFMDSLEKAIKISKGEDDEMNEDTDSSNLSLHDLSEPERVAFFNYIDSKWDEEEGSVRTDVDIGLKDMMGESLVRTRIREELKNYFS